MQDFTLVKSNLRGYELGYIMTQEIKQRIKQLRLNKTPDGYKKTAIGVIPQDWEVINLSDISEYKTKKNVENIKYPTFTNSATEGIIKQTDYFDKEISNDENISGYYLVNKNDFVYNPRISVSAPCGPINCSHIPETGIMSPLYTVFKLLKEKEFYEFFFHSSIWYKYMCSVANYGARSDRMNITNNDFFKMPLCQPPLEEQQKIAAILSTQDKVIELQQKRIDELKKLKKAYLSKMFPQKGSNVPELRFKGFTDLPALPDGQAGGRQVIGNWCVYVLECKNGSLYKGKTNNLLRRITEHMKGQGAEHTKKYKPIKLVYFEAFKTEQEALQKEDYLKSGSGREWLKNNLQKYLPLDYSRPLSYDYYDWEQHKLGECFDERTERSAEGELISVTISEGIKKFAELGRHDNSSEDKSHYKRVEIGDIAYNSMRMWQGASGYSNYSGILSPAYTVCVPHVNVDSLFFSYMFKLPELIHTFEINSQGLTKDTWNLKFPAFSEIQIKAPKNLAEQQKIGSFFRNLDHLITLQSRKLDAEKLKKKSLMQLLLTGIVRVK